MPSNAIEQLYQEGIQAEADGKIEEAYRIWQQIISKPGIDKKYSIIAHQRIQKLRPQMIPLHLKQAREASMQGRWQDESRRWEALLALDPSYEDLAPLLQSPLTLGKMTSNITESIQERLRIAQQNEQFAWMYMKAQQFVDSKESASARIQFQILWENAPYYGDPAGLTQTISLPVALNYEQSIKKNSDSQIPITTGMLVIAIIFVILLILIIVFLLLIL